MILKFDPHAQAVYIALHIDNVAKTEEVTPDILYDVAADGTVLGIELLNISRVECITDTTPPKPISLPDDDFPTGGV